MTDVVGKMTVEAASEDDDAKDEVAVDTCARSTKKRNSIVTSVPSPFVLRNEIVPSIMEMISRNTDKPSPVPPRASDTSSQ